MISVHVPRVPATPESEGTVALPRLLDEAVSAFVTNRWPSAVTVVFETVRPMTPPQIPTAKYVRAVVLSPA
jgi:hypothetical protein